MKYKNKYKNKNHLIQVKNKIKSSRLHFGQLGIISIDNTYLNSKELESCKKNILKKIKGKGTLIVKIYPFLGRTSTPISTRMGKGKGSITKWVFPVRKGAILFEVKSSLENLNYIFNSLVLSTNSLSCKTKIIGNYFNN